MSIDVLTVAARRKKIEHGRAMYDGRRKLAPHERRRDPRQERALH